MENEYIYDYETVCDFIYNREDLTVNSSISACYENKEKNGKYRYVYDIEMFNPDTLQTISHVKDEALYNDFATCERLFKSLINTYLTFESKVN